MIIYVSAKNMPERLKRRRTPPAGPIIQLEPQNNLHTKYTKMERKMNQNGTGREWCSILVSTISMVKIILGFHTYYGTSWTLQRIYLSLTFSFGAVRTKIRNVLCRYRVSSLHLSSQQNYNCYNTTDYWKYSLLYQHIDTIFNLK